MATIAEPMRRQSRDFRLKDLAGIASTIAVLPPGQRLSVTGVNWEAYQFLLRTRDELGCRAVQITYDRGEVEIMTTSSTHEYLKTLLGMLIEQMAISRKMRFMGFGQLTISREDLDRGFEPDECYYFDDAVAPIKAILESRVLQFDVDPCPSLVIEIEVSRSADRRLALYAAMEIPEVWRYLASGTLMVLSLREDGSYIESSKSRYFPSVLPAELSRFLGMVPAKDFGQIGYEFLEYLRTLAIAP